MSQSEQILRALKKGDKIVIDGYQAKDGSKRANGRDLKLPNQIRIRGTSSAQMLGTITWNSSVQNRSAGGLEDADVDRLVAEVIKTLDEKKQDELWRKIGDLLYDRHLSMPLFWLPAEAVYNPKFVSDYVYYRRRNHSPITAWRMAKNTL